MTVFGLHCSHEQIAPSRLLRDVIRAEKAGFDAAMCSDHLAPWTRAQGHSGYAFSWLGAALAATSLPLGVVTAAGYRTHPTTTAQALATLAEMFPGRFWAALGSGEAINEHVTGEPWPEKSARDRRLRECAGIVRDLLAGEEVAHDGEVRVDRARVWSLPSDPPALSVAAVSPETAAAHAGWADGLITVGCDPQGLRDVVDAYRDAGGRGPARLQVHLAWAESEQAARTMARENWIHGTIPPPDLWDLAFPDDIERRAAGATDDEVREAVLVSDDLSVHRDRLAALIEAGFDEVMLHQVGPTVAEQNGFIDAFGEHVLPELRSVA